MLARLLHNSNDNDEVARIENLRPFLIVALAFTIPNQNHISVNILLSNKNTRNARYIFQNYRLVRCNKYTAQSAKL